VTAQIYDGNDMTRTLDDDLAAAAPLVRERTPEFRAALRELIADTSQQTRREALSASRRRRKIAAVTLAATALVGTGTTAAAAGWMPTPWWERPEATVQPANATPGAACSVTYAPRPITVPAHPVSEVDRAAATSAAVEFLRSFDYTGIESTDPDTIFRVLNARLTEALRQQGLSTHAVSVALASDCASEADQ
jgi:hypothetical protein